MAGGSNPNPITIVGDHSGETSGVHGVGASTVESASGAQSKADAAESAAKTYADDNRYTDTEAAAAAPVADVNGQTGSVTVAGGMWSEDGNSPKTVTNTKDITYTLAGEYDIVHISAKMYGGWSDWAIQANGGTGTDYVYVEPSGNQVVGDTYIPVGDIDDSSGGTGVAFGAVVSGRWSTYMYFGPLSPQYGSATQGRFAGTSGPLTQFRLFGSGSGPVPDEVVIEVRGRDIA